MAEMSYDFYTAALSRIVRGEATPFDRAQVSKYEATRFKDWCPKCGQRMASMILPRRIIHDDSKCNDTDSNKKSPNKKGRQASFR